MLSQLKHQLLTQELRIFSVLKLIWLELLIEIFFYNVFYVLKFKNQIWYTVE
jgi:hypothetical protein